MWNGISKDESLQYSKTSWKSQENWKKSHERTEKQKSVVTKVDSAGSVKSKKMEKKSFWVYLWHLQEIFWKHEQIQFKTSHRTAWKFQKRRPH